MFLAWAAGCSSDGETGDLFVKSRSGSGLAGQTSGGAPGPSSAAGGRRVATGGLGPNAQAGEGGAGSSVPSEGGEASVQGGRPSTPVEGGTSGGEAPEPTGGMAPTGGRAEPGGAGGAGASAGEPAAGGAAGSAGEGGSTPQGGEPNAGGGGAPAADGGSGGMPNPPDCDDQNACTDDELGEDGECTHTVKSCGAPASCQSLTCDPASGECEPSPADNGESCDDEQACTDVDACSGGQCIGRATATEAAHAVARDIPDGPRFCQSDQELNPGEPLEIDFEVSAAGQVTNLELTVNLRHPFLADLIVQLVNQESGAEALLIDDPAADDASLDGAYVFADDAPSFAASYEPGELLAPGRYAPADSLGEVFAGLAASGTWRLVVVDVCRQDVGRVRSAGIRIERACNAD